MSYNVKTASEVPEVAAFEQAKQQLQQFRAANVQFFEYFEKLIEQYNITREAAEKIVRGQGISCGDFDLYQKHSKVDAAALHNAVGREAFIAIGGSVKTGTKYSIDQKRLQLAVAQKRVTKELVDEVTSEEPRYHVPKEAAVP